MILIRIERSFRDSSLALSQRTVHVLRVFILLVPIGVSVILGVDGISPSCAATWRASDLPHDVTYCMGWDPSADEMQYKYLGSSVGCLWVSTLNILFAVIFTAKLLKILKMVNSSEEANLRALVLRIDVLTIIGTYILYHSSVNVLNVPNWGLVDSSIVSIFNMTTCTQCTGTSKALIFCLWLVHRLYIDNDWIHRLLLHDQFDLHICRPADQLPGGRRNVWS